MRPLHWPQSASTDGHVEVGRRTHDTGTNTGGGEGRREEVAGFLARTIPQAASVRFVAKKAGYPALGPNGMGGVFDWGTLLWPKSKSSRAEQSRAERGANSPAPQADSD
jgi:hypothetical protein